MGQSIHRLSFGNAGCALSVQKKYFILQMLKQLYILSNPLLARICSLTDETLYWQGFHKIKIILFPIYSSILSSQNLVPCGFGLIRQNSEIK